MAKWTEGLKGGEEGGRIEGRGEDERTVVRVYGVGWTEGWIVEEERPNAAVVNLAEPNGYA